MKNTEDELKRLQAEISSLNAELHQLMSIRAQFPDARVHTSRWNVKRICSAAVNALAVDFEYGHSCSCCPDAGLMVRPYIDTEHGRVHTDPPIFYIGEKMHGGRDRLFFDWDEGLRQANVSAGLIEKISSKFARHAEWDELD